MKSGITVAYSGVHQAYQLALAAEELGQLDCFYCSVFKASGKWGGLLAGLLRDDALLSRRIDGLSHGRVREYPWPIIAHQCRAKLRSATANDWVGTNGWFDRWVARRLKRSDAQVFVGVETCAAESFAIARDREMICVLDCPQVHPEFLKRVIRAAVDDLGMDWNGSLDSKEMLARKQKEIERADYFLTISAIHTRSFTDNGVSRDRVHEVPLWADPAIWYPPPFDDRIDSDALRVLFVGGISLRKGIPYLLEASRQCGNMIRLKLVGLPSSEMTNYLEQYEGEYVLETSVIRSRLRQRYWNADVLVLPSLIDSFGFAAMEAMACGLPVIVSENCGVPVPDPTWRVPIMDSAAIAQRLEYYASNRRELKLDGKTAVEFARRFTPERYREQIKNLYRLLLGNSVP